jgi:methylenetetrahydrofolate dehydrogenase (NADP+)/methenyltetrahydrofolate cyclohydrolase/formyltetrahydrofolate synthetase
MGMHTSSQSMNATVTICHSRTKDIASHCRRGDIIVAALGKAEFVRGDWLKPGCVVIDVGINSKPDSTKKSGYKLVGDVNFDEAVEVSRDI